MPFLSMPPAVALAAGWILGAAFIVAATIKAFRPEGARRLVKSLGLPASAVVVRVLAATEASIGFALLDPAVSATAAVAATTALGVFTAAIVYLRLRGRTESCGCFGGDDLIDRHPVARNALLLLLAAAAGAGGTTVVLLRWLPHAIGALVVAVTAARVVQQDRALTQQWLDDDDVAAVERGKP